MIDEAMAAIAVVSLQTTINPMRTIKILFILTGFALLILVVRETNITDLTTQIQRIGLGGMLFVLGLFTLTFGADVVSWQITLRSVDRGCKWASRLYIVRMIGEAYNNITPMASMGGEPVKAWLLKHNYNVSYLDSGASLVLAKTTSMCGLVIFVGVGFVLILVRPELSVTEKLIAGGGLLGLTLWIIVFFLMQHLKLSTFTATRLGRTRIGQRLSRLISAMHEIDEIFAEFYAHHRRRLLWSMAWAMLSWILGVVEIYYLLSFVGHPISWSDAWIIESIVQLVRTATFFIPAGIGTQEGTLLLTCGAITGNPSLAVAIAIVRRARELIWIALSLALASMYSVSPRSAQLAAADLRGER